MSVWVTMRLLAGQPSAAIEHARHGWPFDPLSYRSPDWLQRVTVLVVVAGIPFSMLISIEISIRMFTRTPMTMPGWPLHVVCAAGQ